ncbi:MAG: glutamate--tRNA ligase, partial [Pseudomonadota bacterium]|nr:glutamate--tRNA ligase [Pseudomonadota bacterium]
MPAVKVRIAPSPTGNPHIGFAYTALCNYLFAKQHSGKLIFRLEDTDQQRLKKHSEQRLLKALQWLGITCDEGTDTTPYRQSERLPIYHKYVERLLAAGHAYRCTCSATRLEHVRAQQRANKEIPKYDRHCRNKNQPSDAPHVVRLKMPLTDKTVFTDMLRGEVSIDNQQLDDQILLKSDGFPTYHLASVVDDYEMQITHVIRAEEWLSSTPKHVQLYRVLGLTMPEFVHLPILRNPDGTKISKRNNPMTLQLLKRLGILPSALLNYLVHIGGAAQTEQEVLTIAAMQANFVLAKLNIGSPVFDWDKLLWLNQKHIAALPTADFCSYVRDELLTTAMLEQLFPLYRERLTHLAEFFPRAQFFFASSLPYSELAVIPPTHSKDEYLPVLHDLAQAFASLQDWQATAIKEQLQAIRKQHDLRTRELFMPVRMITTGTDSSPDLIPTLLLLGQDLVVYRLRSYLAAMT